MMNRSFAFFSLVSILFLSGCLTPSNLQKGASTGEEEQARSLVDLLISNNSQAPSSQAPICGNSVCDEGEALEACPVDCPYNKSFACANGVCEGGESYTSCPQDCGVSDSIDRTCGNGSCESGEDAGNCPSDCTVIESTCGNGVCDSSETESACSADCKALVDEPECNSNSDCGYKQICTSGTCESVDCTNDGQCGYGKECESNRCVRCPRGPYGPAC